MEVLSREVQGSVEGDEWTRTVGLEVDDGEGEGVENAGEELDGSQVQRCLRDEEWERIRAVNRTLRTDTQREQVKTPVETPLLASKPM